MPDKHEPTGNVPQYGLNRAETPETLRQRRQPTPLPISQLERLKMKTQLLHLKAQKRGPFSGKENGLLRNN